MQAFIHNIYLQFLLSSIAVQFKRCQVDKHEKDFGAKHNQLLFNKVTLDNTITRNELAHTRQQISQTNKTVEENLDLLLQTKTEVREAKLNLKEALCATQADLNDTKEELDNSKIEAVSTKTFLLQIKKEFEEMKATLEKEHLSIQNELGQTKHQLSITKKEANETKELLSQTVKELQDTKVIFQEKLSASQNESRQTKEELEDTKTLLFKVKRELDEGVRTDLEVAQQRIDVLEREANHLKLLTRHGRPGDVLSAFMSEDPNRTMNESYGGDSSFKLEVEEDKKEVVLLMDQLFNSQKQQQQQQPFQSSPSKYENQQGSPRLTPSYLSIVQQIFTNAIPGYIYYMNKGECFFKLAIKNKSGNRGRDGELVEQQSLFINHRKDFSSFQNEETTIFANDSIVLNEVLYLLYNVSGKKLEYIIMYIKPNHLQTVT